MSSHSRVSFHELLLTRDDDVQNLIQEKINLLLSDGMSNQNWRLFHNLSTEKILASDNFDAIIQFLENCSSISDFKMYFQNLLRNCGSDFKEKKINFKDSVNYVATVTKEKYLLNNFIDSSYDENDLEIELVDYVERTAKEDFQGLLKPSGVIWFTWNYFNPNDPCSSFRISKGSCSQQEIVNKLALDKTYSQDELRIFQFPVESVNLYRGTIVEAGIESAFVSYKMDDDHGYTYSLDSSDECYSEVDHLSKGCPEAICGFEEINLAFSTLNEKV